MKQLGPTLLLSLEKYSLFSPAFTYLGTHPRHPDKLHDVAHKHRHPHMRVYMYTHIDQYVYTYICICKAGASVHCMSTLLSTVDDKVHENPTETCVFKDKRVTTYTCIQIQTMYRRYMYLQRDRLYVEPLQVLLAACHAHPGVHTSSKRQQIRTPSNSSCGRI